ncbi:Cytoplasmic dynein 1 light intermediate chain 1 [Pteropus alecto]|uniref:Dynein light intermediate chain n=1 Tax=Pteropus alecto TaxID=9402 RepID=L5L3G9_PTEAL|nr:Cytoplasmic dynein 1 light intermediate chain 1 [Pteropus alecto]
MPPAQAHPIRARQPVAHAQFLLSPSVSPCRARGYAPADPAPLPCAERSISGFPLLLPPPPRSFSFAGSGVIPDQDGGRGASQLLRLLSAGISFDLHGRPLGQRANVGQRRRCSRRRRGRAEPLVTTPSLPRSPQALPALRTPRDPVPAGARRRAQATGFSAAPAQARRSHVHPSRAAAPVPGPRPQRAPCSPLGEDGAGKTSLIRKIQGIEEYKKGRGLEYLYLNVHDEDRDDQTRCNVWILDGDLYHKGLLKFSLDAGSLKDTLVMLVVDMSKPWTALDSLQKWASVVREHIDKLKIPPEEMKEMEQKLIRDFQEYVEPGEDFPASPQRRNTVSQEDKDDSVVLPLGADTLTHNLGIPVLVVCTKFVHEKEIVAEDDQVFLMKLQDASPRVPGGSPRTPNRSVSSNVASVSPIPAGSKKIDPNMKAGATSEGVLANFFNSLLSKKTGSPGGPGSPGGGAGGGSSGLPPSAKKSGQKPVLSDVHAELDRITRKPVTVSPTTPTSPTEGEAS